jgi:hypothetical protein
MGEETNERYKEIVNNYEREKYRDKEKSRIY